jgi:hypothetical protein
MKYEAGDSDLAEFFFAENRITQAREKIRRTAQGLGLTLTTNEIRTCAIILVAMDEQKENHKEENHERNGN